MKKIDVSPISNSTGFPVKSGSLIHLQAAYQEAIAENIKSVIGFGYSSAKVYILGGLVNSGSGLNYIISAGSVFFNGEVYIVPAATFSIVAPNAAVGVITTSYFSAVNADPVQFTDGIPRNVHQVRQIIMQSGLSGSGSGNYTDFVKANGSQIPLGGSIDYTPPTGDLSEFSANGLGIAPNVQGWAICNGNNGTTNEEGTVVISYKPLDATFGTLGATGGSKTITIAQNQLPAALTNIGMTIGEAYTGSPVGGIPGSGNNSPTSKPQTLTNPGGGQPTTILNPFIVKLRIQRIY